jgi:HPt (histidine-containing phosphotransfer) domain-containing protein
MESRDDALGHRAAHTLKGLAATVGAKQLSEAARQLEHAFNISDHPAVARCAERVQRFIRHRLRRLPNIAIAQAERGKRHRL